MNVTKVSVLGEKKLSYEKTKIAVNRSRFDYENHELATRHSVNSEPHGGPCTYHIRTERQLANSVFCVEGQLT